MEDEFEVELWEDVKNHPRYEICTAYPYPVRKKKTSKIMSESISNKGYYQLNLDGKNYLKHRIIASQWIYNDDPALKDQVDHINRIKTDNHISNLRWCSRSENNLNRSLNNDTFVDKLPDDVIEVDHYGRHEGLVGLYYYDGIFYLDTGVNYRILNKHQNKQGYYYVYATLLDGPKLQIYYSKFKREYDLD